MAAMKYTHAVVSRIPQSFRTKCDVDLDEARKQHEGYVKLLRELGLDVIELPPDESLPECVYVEDTAIICNGIALIARPNSPSRLKELETIRSVLKKELDLPVVEIEDEQAKLDGGDVLFTGREFFVGLSERTNEAGAKAVAAAFPEYSCIPVTVTDHYRLKNLVSVAGPDLLCVAASKPAQDLIKRIEREASYNYTTLTVPEEKAANVLYVNGTLVHRTEDEIPDSCRSFNQMADFTKRTIKVSELDKLGHSLSSCCLLIRRSKYIKCLYIRNIIAFSVSRSCEDFESSLRIVVNADDQSYDVSGNRQSYILGLVGSPEWKPVEMVMMHFLNSVRKQQKTIL